MGVSHNIKIRRVQSGIDTCEFQLINPDTNQKTALIYDAPVVILVNDRAEFSGKIKRIEKDDNINVWTIFSQNGAADLRDLAVASITKYKHTLPYYIISDLLPATEWTPIQYTGLGNPIDYDVTFGQALTHIQNVCKTQGWEWTARQHTQACSLMGYGTDSITIDYTPDPSDYWTNWYGIMRNGSGINTQFRVTSASGATLTLNYMPEGVATGDKVFLFGKNWFEFGTRIGSSTTATVAHYVINETACWLDRKQNVDKIVTSVVAVGQLPEMARVTTWATACTNNKAMLEVSESWLSLPATAGDTILYPAIITYFPSNGRVQVGSEKIDYTNKTATSLTGCSRGVDSTTATAHYPNDQVLFITGLTFDDTSLLPASGGVWIGSEYIEYTDNDGTSLTTLTRGASGSYKYAHYYGTYAFDGTYSDASPETDSPVALYGIKRKTIEVTGATTRDGLDKRAQQELFKYDDNIEYGEFSLISHDFWQDIRIGDHVLFTDKDATEHEWTIIGVDYDQFRPVKVYFGQSDYYILEDMVRVDTALDVGREKNEPTRSATILQLSTDGKSGLVKYDDDGTSEWKYLK